MTRRISHNHLKNLALVVQEKMLAVSWDKAKLAKEAGIDASGLGRILKGNGNPSFDVLLKIAGAFGCDFRDLFVPESKSSEREGAVAMTGPHGLASEIAAHVTTALRSEIKEAAREGASGLTEEETLLLTAFRNAKKQDSPMWAGVLFLLTGDLKYRQKYSEILRSVLPKDGHLTPEQEQLRALIGSKG